MADYFSSARPFVALFEFAAVMFAWLFRTWQSLPMGLLLEPRPFKEQVSMLEVEVPLYLAVPGTAAPRPVVPLVGQGLQSLCGLTHL